MRLEQEDLNAVGEIVVSRYFRKSGLRYTSLTDTKRILKAYNELEEQYKGYPYMSRDWYVANSADKDAYIARTWKELKKLVDFLQKLGDRKLFNFVVSNNSELALAKVEVERSDLTRDAVAMAKANGYKLYLFTVKVPSNFEYDVDLIDGR